MLLKNWMMVVLGVEVFVVFMLKNVKVSSSLRFGLGFVLMRNRIDLLVLVVCLMLSGVNMLWLMVLFRNRIFVGLMMIDMSGSRLSEMS